MKSEYKKAFVLALLIAIVSTGLAIYGTIKGKGAPWNIVSPSETEMVEVDMVGEFPGGHAAATGEGRFIITYSDMDTVPKGKTWRAYGAEQPYWGDMIKDRVSNIMDRVTVRCKIEVPDIKLKDPGHVRGYVSVQVTYPKVSEVFHPETYYRTYTFQDVKRQIDSEEFSLILYPREHQQAAKLYSWLRLISSVIAMLAWLASVGIWLEGRFSA